MEASQFDGLAKIVDHLSRRGVSRRGTLRIAIDLLAMPILGLLGWSTVDDAAA